VVGQLGTFILLGSIFKNLGLRIFKFLPLRLFPDTEVELDLLIQHQGNFMWIWSAERIIQIIVIAGKALVSARTWAHFSAMRRFNSLDAADFSKDHVDFAIRILHPRTTTPQSHGFVCPRIQTRQ
jgi:hypothetical protein